MDLKVRESTQQSMPNKSGTETDYDFASAGLLLPVLPTGVTLATPDSRCTHVQFSRGLEPAEIHR